MGEDRIIMTKRDLKTIDYEIRSRQENDNITPNLNQSFIIITSVFSIATCLIILREFM